MQGRFPVNFWLVLLVLLPMTATAEVTKAVISVDGMSCPFCAFGVEKKLRSVAGAERVEVTMKDGTATLIAEEGESIELGQIGPAVEAAGFTPGLLNVTAIGTVKKDNKNLLFDVRNSTLTIRLIKLSPQLKPTLLDLANSGTTVSLTGSLAEIQAELPTLTPAKVQEVTP